MTPARRVLWVERFCPYPPTEGQSLRNYHLLREVAKRHAITLVCGVGENDDDVGPLGEMCERVRLVADSDLGPRAPAGRVIEALGGPPGRPRCYVPANLRGYCEAIRELSVGRCFDVALGDLGLAHATVTAGARAWMLDDDNVLDDLYRQLWRAEVWGWRKLAALRDWRAVRSFERRWLPRPDAVTVCSRRDRTRMQSWGRSLPPLHVIPNGVDLQEESFSAGPRDPDMLIMAGIMSWLPNEDGARFLVRHVMPRVWAARPTARLWLIGRDPSPRVLCLAGERVVVTGKVSDVRPYRWRAAVELVPLFAGGGTRLKILQAMAAGVPVVSTDVGAEGLELRAGEEIWIANGADEMAGAILQLLSEPSSATALAGAARRRVEADFGWDAIGSQLADLIEALVRDRLPGRG